MHLPDVGMGKRAAMDCRRESEGCEETSELDDCASGNSIDVVDKIRSMGYVA